MCASNFALDWKIQCCRKLWNVEINFWQANIENNASFWVVFQVQKWCGLAVAERRRKSIDKKNRLKCGFNKLSSETEESPCVSCWHMGHYFGSVQNILKDNFNVHLIVAKFLPDCCYICTCLLSEQQKENCVMMWPSGEVSNRLRLASDMFLFPAEDGVKGREGGLMYHHHSSRIAGCTCQDSNSALHTSLGPLYTVPRRLL